MKTLYITKNPKPLGCNYLLNIATTSSHYTTQYEVNQKIQEWLCTNKVDKIDVLVLDSSSYQTILRTSKVIENYVWSLQPTMINNVKHVVVIATDSEKSIEEGREYLRLLEVASRYNDKVATYKLVHISEWEQIKSDYEESPEIAVDFEASSLYPQQVSFYIGGIGLYDGKQAYYVYDNHLGTRLDNTIVTQRDEWKALGEYLNEKRIKVYNYGYENKIFSSKMSGPLRDGHDVLADLRCVVKSGSLKVTAVRGLGIPDWADIVQQYVEYTNNLLSWLRVKNKGEIKWYKHMTSSGDGPVFSQMISLYEDYRNTEVGQLVRFELEDYLTYLRRENKEPQLDDVIWSKGVMSVSIRDLPNPVTVIDILKKVESPDDLELIGLIADISTYLLEEQPVVNGLGTLTNHAMKSFSPKDYNIYSTWLKVENLLEQMNCSTEDYGKLIVMLGESNEECKYTDLPLKTCADYCIMDTIHTYNLGKVVELEIKARNIEEASWMYQQQCILADRMERAGIAWDDEVAQKHQDIYLATALESLRKLYLSDRGVKLLELTPAQMLHIETCTDVNELKTYLSPMSTHKATAKKWSYMLVDVMTKIGYMYYELHTEWLKHPDSDWFSNVYPTLSKYYFKMKDMECFYENYGEDADGNKLKFNDVPRETMERWLSNLREELTRQASNFRNITEECLETRRDSEFRFKEEGKLQRLEFEMIEKVRNFVLPGTSAATIEWMYEVYTKALGVNAEEDWTWTECFWNLYHFRMFKKVMKSNNTYVEGSPGREAVIRMVNSPTEDTVIFDEFYNDVGGDKGNKEAGSGWICKSQFGSNVAQTKRWKCLVGSTPVVRLKGDSAPIKDIQVGDYVYSYDTSRKEFVYGKVQGHVQSGVKSVVEVEFDDGFKLRCTDNHRILRSDGTYVNAGDLKENDSIRALNMKSSHDGYEMIITSDESDKYQRTHHWVKNQIEGQYDYSGKVIHHVDFNKRNNTPENLRIMRRDAHWKLHADHAHVNLHTPEVAAKRKASLQEWAKNHPEHYDMLSQKGHDAQRTKLREDPEFLKRKQEHSRKNIQICHLKREENSDYVAKRDSHFSQLIESQWKDDSFRERHSERARKSIKKCHKKQWSDPEFLEGHAQRNKGRKFEATLKYQPLQYLYKSGNLNKETYDDLRKRSDKQLAKWESLCEYCDVYERLSQIVHNHRVVSVTQCSEEMTYDISIEGPSNFVVGSRNDDGTLFGGIVVHNSGQHTVPWSSENQDRRVSRFGDKGLRVHYDYCLHKDTQVLLSDTTYATVGDLLDKFNKGEEVKVISRDEEGDLVSNKVTDVFVTGTSEEMYELELPNGYKFKCTPHHKFILKDGSIKMAKDLTTKDELGDISLITCEVCGNQYKQLTKAHLDTHGITQSEYGRPTVSEWCHIRKSHAKSGPVSEYQRQRIKEGADSRWTNPEEREKASAKRKEYYLVEENRVAQSERTKVQWTIPEVRRKMRQGISDTMKTQSNEYRYSKGEVGWFEGPKCERFKYKSKIEREFAEVLTNESYVSRFVYEPCCIEYQSHDGEIMAGYTPDYLVEFADGSKMMYELKSSKSHKATFEKTNQYVTSLKVTNNRFKVLTWEDIYEIKKYY